MVDKNSVTLLLSFSSLDFKNDVFENKVFRKTGKGFTLIGDELKYHQVLRMHQILLVRLNLHQYLQIHLGRLFVHRARYDQRRKEGQNINEQM